MSNRHGAGGTVAQDGENWDAIQSCWWTEIGQQGGEEDQIQVWPKNWQSELQAIEEVRKPLASAAKIANKGNIIVLDGDGCDSYIFNKPTMQKIPIYQENNVYAMDVDFMIEGTDSLDKQQPPFQRQV